ncbi:MAG TPA: methylmalonyl-CoA mutase family protein, partial [Acidimicrobiales bacterium]
VADPLGGSWFVEELTDEMERQAEEIFAHLLEAGSGSMLEGAIACIEDGWFVSEIADAAYHFQSKVARGEWIQVGVNGYVEEESTTPNTLYIDPAVEVQQLASLAEVKQQRDDELVRRSLARLRSEAEDPTVNLMPALIEAAHNFVTVGESMAALESVFGQWFERSVA